MAHILKPQLEANEIGDAVKIYSMDDEFDVEGDASALSAQILASLAQAGLRTSRTEAVVVSTIFGPGMAVKTGPVRHVRAWPWFRWTRVPAARDLGAENVRSPGAVTL